MKLYTIYSDSHKVLYEDYFVKTLPKDISLNSFTAPQLCQSGSFYSDGWADICYKKTDIFLQACEENKGGVFVFSDVDVQFFVDEIEDILLEELEDYDLACQYDTGSYPYCTGFFVCRVNDRTIDLFRSIQTNYIKEDQTSLHHNIYKCKAKFLSYRFFNVAHELKTQWTGQMFDIPNDIVLHHANWVVGVEKKIQLLNLVKNKHDEYLSKIPK